MKFRAFYSDNAIISDISVNINDYFSGVLSTKLVAAEDAIYIASKFPFNGFYLKMAVANELASTMSVKLWDGSAFQSVDDIIDETILTGCSLGKSGHVSFIPSNDHGWSISDTQNIPELASLKLYEFYWMKLTFSSALEGPFIDPDDEPLGRNPIQLSWLGHLYSDDNSLRALGYSDLVRSNVMTAYEAGKTSWQEQHVKAAEVCIDTLITKNQIASGNQILDWQQLDRASAHKCAEIIYSSFGDDYTDQKENASKAFDKAISMAYPIIDENSNAKVDNNEKYTKWNTGEMHRR